MVRLFFNPFTRLFFHYTKGSGVCSLDAPLAEVFFLDRYPLPYIFSLHYLLPQVLSRDHLSSRYTYDHKTQPILSPLEE